MAADKAGKAGTSIRFFAMDWSALQSISLVSSPKYGPVSIKRANHWVRCQPREFEDVTRPASLIHMWGLELSIAIDICSYWSIILVPTEIDTLPSLAKSIRVPSFPPYKSSGRLDNYHLWRAPRQTIFPRKCP